MRLGAEGKGRSGGGEKVEEPTSDSQRNATDKKRPHETPKEGEGRWVRRRGDRGGGTPRETRQRHAHPTPPWQRSLKGDKT